LSELQVLIVPVNKDTSDLWLKLLYFTLEKGTIFCFKLLKLNEFFHESSKASSAPVVDERLSDKVNTLLNSVF